MRAQIRSIGLTEMATQLQTSYEIRMTHREACDRYKEEFNIRGILPGPSDVDRLQDLKRVLKLGDTQMAVGAQRVGALSLLFLVHLSRTAILTLGLPVS